MTTHVTPEPVKRLGTSFVPDGSSTDARLEGLPILYTFKRCPYAVRARMMLAACGITYEIREVVLKHKPVQLLNLSPKGTVPVLEVPAQNKVIDESLDIMLWSVEQNDPHRWLEIASQQLTSPWVEENDHTFKQALDTYKYEHSAEAKKVCFDFARKLDIMLERQTWLGGDRLTPLDLAIFPFIRQLHRVDAQSATPRLLAFEHTYAWLYRLLESELFASVMGKHNAWTPSDEPIVYHRGRWTAPARTAQPALAPAESTPTSEIRVAAFYHFVHIDDIVELQSRLQAQMRSLQICGSILLAREGINGTVAGSPQALDRFIRLIQEDARFKAMSLKFQTCESMPFRRAKVRLKKEIVACKDLSIDPHQPPPGAKGAHLDADAWDKLLAKPGVKIIDVRNDYEYQLGHFEEAINPRTRSFGEFVDFVKGQLDPARDRTIAMYCTGGIRCEKASVIMQKMGFEEVFQLDGGILKYLEDRKKRPKGQPKWHGDCFVFDERIALNADLRPAGGRLCAKCGQPCHPADGCLVCGL